MPKENTHLHFAAGLVPRLPAPGRQAVEQCPEAYRLGSILLDSLYYSRDPAIERLSATWHAGRAEAGFAFAAEALLAARDTGLAADLAFGLGLVTHLALDGAFHPAIDAIVGNPEDPEPVLAVRALHDHRLLETALDRAVCCGKPVELPLDPALAASLAALRGLPREPLLAAFHRMARAHRWFRSTSRHLLVRTLSLAGLLDRSVPPLFYASLGGLARGTRRHAACLLARLPVTGLLCRAEGMGNTMLGVAMELHQGHLDHGEFLALAMGASPV